MLTYLRDTLNGDNLQPVDDSTAVGGLLVVVPIVIADGAGDTDVEMKNKVRLVDMWAVKTSTAGGAGDTVQAKNGADVITDALVMNVADEVLVRAGSIDDANHEIAAGGTLRITAANATNNACVVYALLMRV